MGSGLLSDFRLWKVCARLGDERELCGMPGPPAPAVLSDSHILSRVHPPRVLPLSCFFFPSAVAEGTNVLL